MNPTILGVIGPGFLNQVPTLVMGMDAGSRAVQTYGMAQALPQLQRLRVKRDGDSALVWVSGVSASACLGFRNLRS